MGGGGAATAGLVLGWVTTTLSLVVVGLAALATPQINKALERATLAENMGSARQVKLALDGYASDFDGKYPSELDALVDNGLLVSLEEVGYLEHKSKKVLGWIYFAGQEDTSNVANVILASPVTVRYRNSEGRLVVRIDGSTKVMPEADFQNQIRLQGGSLP